MGFFLYTKIRYRCTDEFWNRVRAYNRAQGHATLNDSVTELLTDALDRFEAQQEKSVYGKLTHAQRA